MENGGRSEFISGLIFLAVMFALILSAFIVPNFGA